MNLKYSNILGFTFLSFFIFEGLDAYSVKNIPIYWIGASLFIAIFVLLFLSGFRASAIKITSIRNWTIYAVFVTLVQSLFNDLVLPKYASTTYFQYISLRLFKILLFLIILYTLNYLLSTYSFETVLKYFLISSLIISSLSLISYFSYIFGYPDFPRTRSGSGGWTQPIARACNILRNYGTFREPSFLAIWTVPFLPYFFYIGKKNKIWYFLALIPILSVVLSRSLTRFVALIVSSVLVLPEGIFSECLDLFEFSIQCAIENPHITFLWRTHPLISLDLVVSRISFHVSIPDNIYLSNNSFKNDIQTSQACLYKGSTAVVTAASSGLIPIYYNPCNFPDTDPLFCLSRFRPCISSVSSFSSALNWTLWDFESINLCKQLYTPINLNFFTDYGFF